MSPQLRARLTAAAIAVALAGAAGCGDEDTEPDVADPPAAVESAPADAADEAPVPGEATPPEGDPGPAEQAAEDVLGRAEGQDQKLADSVREAARRFDAEVEGAGGASEEGVARARGGIERAIQDADPRTRKGLEDLLGEIDERLTTQGGAG